MCSNEKTELKPCPFCGGEAEHKVAETFEEDQFYVQCSQCWVESAAYENEEKAAEAWNCRVGECKCDTMT